MRLAGKVAIITGAGGGIGRAAAIRFASEGAVVVSVDREAAAARETHERVQRAGGRGLVVEADLTRPDHVAPMADAVARAFGQVQVLFNVAGISGRRFGDGPVHQCSEAGWDQVMDSNLKSVFLCCKYVLPLMLQANGGSIINLSSVLGLVGGGAHFATHAYAASKAGIIGLTRAMAVHYATHGVRVNALCPGLVRTPMSRRAQDDPEIVQQLRHLQPLTGTLATPEDVVGAALFLASDDARFVTGAVLPVDGGWSAQ